MHVMTCLFSWNGPLSLAQHIANRTSHVLAVVLS